MNTLIETARGKLSRLPASFSRRRWTLGVLVLLIALAAVVVVATRSEPATVAKPVARTASAPVYFTGAEVISTVPAKEFWASPSASAIRLASVEGVDGASAVAVTVAPKREFFTIVEHQFPKAQVWSKRPWLFLEFRGKATGAVYSLSIALVGDRSVSYAFVDTTSGWSVLAFDLSNPDEGKAPGDTRVTSVRVASPSKDAAATFALGRLSISAPQR